MNSLYSPVDKDYHRGAIRLQMDEHHSKDIALNQVLEVRAYFYSRAKEPWIGFFLGTQVNGVKLVNKGVSKDYQNITRKMHMRTLLIMVCFFGIVVRSALEVMV